jgi:hypothetical protein
MCKSYKCDVCGQDFFEGMGLAGEGCDGALHCECSACLSKASSEEAKAEAKAWYQKLYGNVVVQ